MSKLTLIASKNNRSKIKTKNIFEDVVDKISMLVSNELTEASNFCDFEKVLLEISNEVDRQVLQAKLEQVSSQYEAEYLLVNGLRHKQHTKGTVEYHTLCGSIKIERYTYRQTGVHNGPTVVPLELSAQLQERVTPALAYRAALGDAQCPGRQWEEQLWACHRRPPSRSTLERVAKKIGAAAKEVAPEILPIIRAKEMIHKEAVALSIGLDRTTIPMEEKLRCPQNTAPIKRRKKPYIRKAPLPVEVNYRMAYLGTVSVLGSDQECLQTYRYGCSADVDPSGILKEMTNDLVHIQNQRKENRLPELPMGIVQDGAPEMWNLVESKVEQALPDKHFEKAIDRYHLAERLAESLKALKDPLVNRNIRMREWNSDLETSDNAINKIEKFIIKEHRRLKKLNRLSVANAEILRTHLTYIKNNKHLMHYASIKKQGLPTGSGATEGACKSLIMIRAKRCGQRWHPNGVNAVVTLRSLHQNNRLSQFWSKMCEQKSVNIQEAA